MRLKKVAFATPIVREYTPAFVLQYYNSIRHKGKELKLPSAHKAISRGLSTITSSLWPNNKYAASINSPVF